MVASRIVHLGYCEPVYIGVTLAEIDRYKSIALGIPDMEAMDKILAEAMKEYYPTDVIQPLRDNAGLHLLAM